LTDKKCNPAEHQNDQDYLVDSGRRQNTRLMMGIGLRMYIAQQFTLSILRHMTGKTGLIVDRFVLTVKRVALMTPQTIGSAIGPTEILFAMRSDLQRRQPGQIIRLTALPGMAALTGLLQPPGVNGRTRVVFG